MQRKYLIIGAIAFLLIIGFIFVAFRHRKDLSEKPDRYSEQPTFPTSPSKIGIFVDVPIDEISKILNEKIPSSYGADGTGSDACIEVGYRIPMPWPLPEVKDTKKVCAGTQYSMVVERKGPISLTSSAKGGCRFTMSVSISGKGGFRGDGAVLTGLDAKNFATALYINVDFNPKVNPDWSINPNLDISYNWINNPKVEVVHNVWVDIKGQVEKAVDDKIPEIIETANSAVANLDLKSKMVPFYRTNSVQLSNDNKLYANVTPLELGFSGINFISDHLQAAISLDANVEISTEQITARALPVPNCNIIGNSAPLISLNVPIRVPYSILQETISKKLIGQKLSSPSGEASIALEGFHLYPTHGGALVIGVDISTRFPHNLFETKGVVYLTCTPSIENGTALSLSKLTFTNQLDREFWQATAHILEDALLKVIGDSAKYDFSKELASANSMALDLVSKKQIITGFSARLDSPNLSVGRIAVSNEDFAIEAKFNGSLILEKAR